MLKYCHVVIILKVLRIICVYKISVTLMKISFVFVVHSPDCLFCLHKIKKIPLENTHGLTSQSMTHIGLRRRDFFV